MLHLWNADASLVHNVARVIGTAIAALGMSGMIWLVYYLVYNAFFHPLARYPGPFLAKFTNLYAAYHSYRGDIHKDMHRCHVQYGDRFRYAPGRLIIDTPDALQAIYGHRNNVKKFDGYHVLAASSPNTLTMTDKTAHARRRRVISQGFSEASLRLFAPVLRARIDRFCQELRAHRAPGQAWTAPLDMAPQYAHLAFDTMTAVSFDTDYHMTDAPTYRYVLPAIELANLRLSVISQALVLTTGHLDRYLFMESAMAAWTFGKFLYKLLKKRLAEDEPGADQPAEQTRSGKTHRDLFALLQQCRDPETGQQLSHKELSTETATFVVAGSDTTGTTLASVTHYLTGSPRCYRRARDEVRGAFASAADVQMGPALNACHYLRACIDESLRLSPPGGSAAWREVDRGGAVIDGSFYGAGCEVGVAVYAMHHDARYWTEPFQFRPERWLDDSKALGAAGKARPYMPFSIGPRSCVGKPLAIAQMMLALALLLVDFDIRRADAAESWDEQTEEAPTVAYELVEHITSWRKGPIVCFRERE